MLKMWSLFIVTANSYLPKECNSCPKMVLRVSLNSVSQDTRLTAAPVLTNFFGAYIKIKIWYSYELWKVCAIGLC